MTLLIVSPLHNEEANVAGLVAMLETQVFQDFDWYVVDDGSTDDTVARLRAADTSGRARLVSKRNDGGLIGGSAYSSWRHGVATALADSAADGGPDYTHVMKLDADVRLAPDYLDIVVPQASGDVGVCGGIIVTPGMTEQKVHVPGPVKLFTREAYHLAESLPTAIGNDVMDEVAVAQGGLRTLVDERAHFDLTRSIGSSEGKVHGRYRNGRVCRWTGYDPVYFLGHVVRYLVREPRVIGAFAVLWGYLRAGSGPYDPALKTAHRRSQRKKLRHALTRPMDFYRRVYRVPRKD